MKKDSQKSFLFGGQGGLAKCMFRQHDGWLDDL